MDPDKIVAKTDTEEITAENLLQNERVVKDKSDPDYEETDIFLWSNNLVQYVDEMRIEMYLFSKNQTAYRVKMAGDAARQLRPLFIDEILEYVLGGVERGLIVRDFEAAAKEDNVLQKTKVKNVDKLVDVLRWIKNEQSNIEEFKDEEHDIKRIRGVIAVCDHADFKEPFYVIKSLPGSQVMKGHTAWLLKDNVFKPFDNLAAIKIPGENQMIAIGQDLFVFNEAKLKSLFGYDAKAASVAAQKVDEIERNFKLSFAEGLDMQSLIKGKPAMIKKLQKLFPGLVKQEELLAHAEDLDIGLMTDESGAIIIVDEKDLVRFINLLNDDYVESGMTGERYEIINKKPLKPPKTEE